jgi:hypothetical protein
MSPITWLFNRKAEVLEGRRCAGCRKRLTKPATPSLMAERKLCLGCSLAYCDSCALKLVKGELRPGFVVKNWLYRHPTFGSGMAEFSRNVFVCKCGGPVIGEFNEIVFHKQGGKPVPVNSNEIMSIVRS